MFGWCFVWTLKTPSMALYDTAIMLRIVCCTSSARKMPHPSQSRFEPINTAVFIFANLQNIYESWLNPNVNGYQEPVPFFSQKVLGMAPALYGASASLFERNLGGIPTVYTQFADGFSALQASSNRQFACTGLLQCFNALSARAEPTNVIMVGHALGGAYATVGGPWAAIAFPQSTIQVATAGAPAVVANNLFYVVRGVGTDLRYMPMQMRTLSTILSTVKCAHCQRYCPLSNACTVNDIVCLFLGVSTP